MLRRLLGLNVIGSVLALSNSVASLLAVPPTILLRADVEWATVDTIGDVLVTSEKGNPDRGLKVVVA